MDLSTTGDLNTIKQMNLQLMQGISMELSEASIEQELLWWITYTPWVQKHICYPTPSMIIQADVSKKGWGAVFDGRKIGGRWTLSEALRHINLLELQAAFFGLNSFADHTRGIHIQLQLDNTTAVAYVNNMGGSKSLELDQLANDLWEWSISQEIWVSAVHIPGISNIDADEQSRNFNDEHEWALNTGALQEITAEYPDLTTDLIATRLNHEFDTYCSWKPDPGCSFVDAFSQNWHPFHFLCISTFQPDPTIPPKNQQGQGYRHSHCLVMAKPTMVPIVSSASLQNSMDPEPSQEPPSTPRSYETPASVEKTEIDGMYCLRNSFTNYNISGHVAYILMASWCSSTRPTLNSDSSFLVKGKLIAIPHKWVKL